jgi:hypothetical protein
MTGNKTNMRANVTVTVTATATQAIAMTRRRMLSMRWFVFACLGGWVDRWME